MIRKTFKYRLYPTKRQVEILDGQLAEACRLYNAALQERRDAWRLERKSISFYDQSYQLKAIRASGDLGLPTYDIAHDVLARVDKAFKAFFRRVKEGKGKAGFPRFRASARYDSLTHPHGGRDCKIVDGRKVRFSGVGLIRIKLHRPLEGKPKTLSIKREAGRWFACFSVEQEPKPLLESKERVGVDVGLASFATLSDGREVENPRYFEAARMMLRRAQRKVARRKRGGNRRRKAVQVLARLHSHVRNQRSDFHHKRARELVNTYGLIAVEDLNVRGMAQTRFGKSIHDAGWSSFIDKLTYKAEEAGRKFVKVDPRGTSQRCVCGAEVRKTLADRWHECKSCGLSVSRDRASAMEILRLGLSLQAVT
ncbi:MAG: RNA-guided endonuclease InsQ/TnpB family protein [Pyrinomonadaceae bacterium]